MKIINYLKNNGIRKTVKSIYQYQIDKYLLKVIKFIFKNRDLEDIIVIESHNDFDCNGGALYSYLIQKRLNEKYKIVWLLKHSIKCHSEFPSNVVCVPLFKPSFRKNYYAWIAKYFVFDNYSLEKQRDEQMYVYLTHGAGGLKNVKGLITLPEWVDYILIQSETYAHIEAEQYLLSYPNKRLVCLGYPSHDILLGDNKEELRKVSPQIYKKNILWMPTFRKGKEGRNDSMIEQPLGIPLISSFEELGELNSILRNEDSLLIIKIHPMQDMSVVKLKNMSNIVILNGRTVKERQIDNYRLMSCADALISDYSGVAYEFLQLNRPIAYVLSDAKEYKLGFVVENIDDLIAGDKIYTLNDLKQFIGNVCNEKDSYKKRREELREYIYKYHDQNNCKRLLDFMGIC